MKDVPTSKERGAEINVKIRKFHQYFIIFIICFWLMLLTDSPILISSFPEIKISSIAFV